MDKVEEDGTPVSHSISSGATEVEGNKDSNEEASGIHDVTKPRVASQVSDGGTNKRSSRRKPNKTHRVVDSEDEEDGDDGGHFDEYLKGKMFEGLTTYSGSRQASGVDSANSGADDGEEEDENEGEEEMDENGADDGRTEEAPPPHLPEGTVVVQPVAVEDCSPPSFRHTSDFPYGRKTRTDVIPDHVMCTACEHRIPTNSIDNFYRHPVLKVLLCRRCIAVYETKPIRTGDDGLDDACRWCAEGGDLICCDFCHNAFCKGCIERNIGQEELDSILNAGDSEKWHCYVCHPQLLAKHVESCNAIIASVEEREKVARRRQKSGAARSPRRNQLMPSKAQMGSVPDTAALASAIASHVMSAGVGRRGGAGRPRGRGASNAHGASSKGDVLYIRTPSGGVVGIPAKSMEQMGSSPMSTGEAETQAKPRQTSRASRSPRGSATRSQFTNLPSLPMTSVTLSSSPPNINEYNVWSVLEKLLAATQSMGMLLGSLKDDLRRTGSNIVALEQLKKRREVAMKLWRAFVAYKKSFLDIEMFTRAGTASNQTPQPAAVQPARGSAAASRTQVTPKNTTQPVEKSDASEKSIVLVSTEVKRTDKKELREDAVAQKRRAEDDVENGHATKQVRLDSESADVQSGSVHDERPTTDAGQTDTTADDRAEDKEKDESAENKGDLFSSLHFEPLFEIKPMAKKE